MHGIAEKKIDKIAIFISCLLPTLKTVPKRIRRIIPENSAPVEKRPNATVYALLPNAYADLAIKGIVPNRIPEMIVQIIPVVSEAKPLSPPLRLTAAQFRHRPVPSWIRLRHPDDRSECGMHTRPVQEIVQQRPVHQLENDKGTILLTSSPCHCHYRYAADRSIYHSIPDKAAVMG